jgi:hypothetical protein
VKHFNGGLPFASISTAPVTLGAATNMFRHSNVQRVQRPCEADQIVWRRP